MSQYKTIAESNKFIVLDTFTKYSEVHEAPAAYQTVLSLEKECIQDLFNQGYEHPLHINTPEAMLANVRVLIKFYCQIYPTNIANMLLIWYNSPL